MRPPKRSRGLAMGEEQRELLRGGEEDFRRPLDLPRPLVRRRIAGAGFDADRQAHLGDRRLEIAGDVDRKGLQRRDVEGVQAAPLAGPQGAALRQLRQGRQEAGQRLAGAGRRDEERGATGPGLGEEVELMRPRLPAAAFEPAQERLRKERFGARRHGPKVGRAAQGRKSRGIRLSPPAG